LQITQSGWQDNTMSGIRRWWTIFALLHRMNEKHKVKPTEGEITKYKKKKVIGT